MLFKNIGFYSAQIRCAGGNKQKFTADNNQLQTADSFIYIILYSHGISPQPQKHFILLDFNCPGGF